MNQVNKWMEKFWLLFSIVALLYALYEISFGIGWANGSKYLYFSFIPFFWWLFRKKMRERVERVQREKQQASH